MLNSPPEHGTSIWYNSETGNVSFTDPVDVGDPDPFIDRLEPSDGEEALMEAAQRIAEGVCRLSSVRTDTNEND